MVDARRYRVRRCSQLRSNWQNPEDGVAPPLCGPLFVARTRRRRESAGQRFSSPKIGRKAWPPRRRRQGAGAHGRLKEVAMTEHVKSEVSGGVLSLTLQRPDKKNALTDAM